MKSIKNLLASIVLSASALTPVLSVSAVKAAVVVDLSQCNFSSQSQVPCDLALKKEVRINDGAYFDANSAGEAVNAAVGDTVTWRITVTNTLPTTMPEGDVSVTELLPSGVNFVSATASTGTYSGDSWLLNVGSVVGEGYINHLPATLEITTTATTVGMHENRADLAAYYCDGPCEYEDGNTSNNFDLAYVNIENKSRVLGETTTTTKPQVLASTTLADTGASTILPSFFGLSVVAATLLITRLTRIKHDI